MTFPFVLLRFVSAKVARCRQYDAELSGRFPTKRLFATFIADDVKSDFDKLAKELIEKGVLA
jgi:hypothetical protein